MDSFMQGTLYRANGEVTGTFKVTSAPLHMVQGDEVVLYDITLTCTKHGDRCNIIDNAEGITLAEIGPWLESRQDY